MVTSNRSTSCYEEAELCKKFDELSTLPSGARKRRIPNQLDRVAKRRRMSDEIAWSRENVKLNEILVVDFQFEIFDGRPYPIEFGYAHARGANSFKIKRPFDDDCEKNKELYVRWAIDLNTVAFMLKERWIKYIVVCGSYQSKLVRMYIPKEKIIVCPLEFPNVPQVGRGASRWRCAKTKAKYVWSVISSNLKRDACVYIRRRFALSPISTTADDHVRQDDDRLGC